MVQFNCWSMLKFDFGDCFFFTQYNKRSAPYLNSYFSIGHVLFFTVKRKSIVSTSAVVAIQI